MKDRLSGENRNNILGSEFGDTDIFHLGDVECCWNSEMVSS
jgi:hypothetical protein